MRSDQRSLGFQVRHCNKPDGQEKHVELLENRTPGKYSNHFALLRITVLCYLSLCNIQYTRCCFVQIYNIKIVFFNSLFSLKGHPSMSTSTSWTSIFLLDFIIQMEKIITQFENSVYLKQKTNKSKTREEENLGVKIINCLSTK